MATAAAALHFSARGAREPPDLGGIAASLDMVGARSVTAFATALGNLWLLQGGDVTRGGKTLVLLLVAALANIRADVFIRAGIGLAILGAENSASRADKENQQESSSVRQRQTTHMQAGLGTARPPGETKKQMFAAHG